MANRRDRRRQQKLQKNGKATPNIIGASAAEGNLMSQAAALYEAGDVAGAKSTFEVITTMNPGHADALFGLGVLEEQAGNLEVARKHYQTAIAGAPNHAPSLTNLGNILRNERQFEAAIGMLEQAAVLAQDVPLVHNNLGIALHQGGAIERAIAAFQEALALAPDFVEAHCNLGAVYADQDQFAEAAECFKRAITLDPHHAPALANLGNAFNGLHRVDDAIAALEKALENDPGFAFAYAKLATVYERLNDLEKAEEYILKSKSIDTDNPEVSIMNGIILGRNKKYEEAVEQITYGIPFVSSPNIVSRAHFEAGHSYDRLNDSRKAFYHYSAGNALIEEKAVRFNVDRENYLEEINKNINIFNKEWVDDWSSLNIEDSNSPIFIVGFPRSGTTLLEQILDSHPKIQALDEKPVIEDTIKYINKSLGEHPSNIGNVSNDNIEKIKEIFYNEVSKYLNINNNLKLVVKMPLNLVNVGFIFRIFPNAKFIFTERHPCDACLSCFMQHFTLNRAMTHFTSLESTAHFYALVMGLWRQYVELLPLNWHALRYEALVEDFEGVVRPLLEFLGLEWDDSVLAFDTHAQGRGAIMTPSYSQVTQPIYSSSKERWRRYEEEMRPILPILEPFIRYFGYDADLPNTPDAPSASGATGSSSI
jgi:tetratricopeptide (TPR) repeat protein